MRASNKGQSLFEIVVAVGVAGVIIGSATVALMVSVQSGKTNTQIQQAYAVAQEILNNARSYADSDFATFYQYSPNQVGAAQYYLTSTSTQATSTSLSVNSGTKTVKVRNDQATTTYTTWFVLENLYRDSAGDITTNDSETEDPSTLRATAYVSWTVEDDTRQIELSQHISKTRTETFEFTDWSGTSGATTTTDASAGTANYYYAESGIIATSSGQSLTISPTASASEGAGASEGVTITQSGGGTAVTEGGNTDSYTVALDAAPSASVTITISPDAEVQADRSTLTFTTTNWGTAQTVVVTAVDDSDGEGSHTGTIAHSASSADQSYDGISISGVEVSVTDNDPVTMNIQIAAGTDDGYRRGNGNFGSTDSNVTVGRIDYNGETFNIWLRFAGITIPRNSTINSATIDFVGAPSAPEGSNVRTKIYLVDEDNHAAPASGSDWSEDHSIHTAASVDWDFAPVWSGTGLTTTDFKTALQEVVNRSGWVSGNAIGVHVDNDGSGWGNSHTVAAYENTSYNPPTLNITYTP